MFWWNVGDIDEFWSISDTCNPSVKLGQNGLNIDVLGLLMLPSTLGLVGLLASSVSKDYDFAPMIASEIISTPAVMLASSVSEDC